MVDAVQWADELEAGLGRSVKSMRLLPGGASKEAWAVEADGERLLVRRAGGGVISFTRDLACKWARHGIRVNAIAPGWFPSDMANFVLEQHGDELASRIPLGRFGGPEDLKGVVVFLASDASAYVTAHTLVVDGGQSAW